MTSFLSPHASADRCGFDHSVGQSDNLFILIPGIQDDVQTAYAVFREKLTPNSVLLVEYPLTIFKPRVIDEIVEVILQIAPCKVTFIGFSMGAIVAAQVAARLQALIALNANDATDLHIEVEGIVAWNAPALLDDLVAARLAKIGQHLAFRWLNPLSELVFMRLLSQPAKAEPDVDEDLVQEGLAYGQSQQLSAYFSKLRFIGQLKASWLRDLNLKLRIAYVRSEDDEVIAEGAYRHWVWLSGKGTSSQLFTLANAKHCDFVIRPRAARQLLAEAIEFITIHS